MRSHPVTSLFLGALLAAAGSLVAGHAVAADHDVDASFGAQGYPGWARLFEPGEAASQDQHGVAFARTADGGFVVVASLPGGGANNGTGVRIGLFWVDADGSWSTANDFVSKDAWFTSITDMAIDSQGRIVVLGETPGPGGLNDFAVARFLPDGSDDISFAGDGATAIGMDSLGSSFDDELGTLLIDRDDRILIAGNSTYPGQLTQFGVVRLNQNGTRDSSFGNIDDGQGGRRGTLGRFIGAQAAYGVRLVPISDDYMVLVGNTQESGSAVNFAATVLRPDGVYWADDEGSISVAVSADPIHMDFVKDATWAGSDRVLIAGTSGDRCAAIRILATTNQLGEYVHLTLDDDFVGSAQVGNPNRYIGTTSGTSCAGVTVDSQGRAILVGLEGIANRPGPLAAGHPKRPVGSGNLVSGLATRLLPNGSPDPTFGVGGDWWYNASTGGGGQSHNTALKQVVMAGDQPVLLGTSADDPTGTDDMDAVLTRLGLGAGVFSDGFE
ncbi:MAG TPA: hypothetical protein VFN29_12615 [Chiayiivirga sp.]|nr:hypothetical protein [Chiayiivirga sp.]